MTSDWAYTGEPAAQVVSVGNTKIAIHAQKFGSDPIVIERWRGALHDPLVKSQIFNSTQYAPPTAEYHIEATLQAYELPVFMLEDEPIHTRVLYRLYLRDILVKEFEISAEGKADFSDSLVGVHRYRIALERSLRRDTELFLQELAAFLNKESSHPQRLTAL